MDRSARDVPRSSSTGGEHQNVFDELKNQWGFAGLCAQKAGVSKCQARLLLVFYNLWSMFVRVLKDEGMHTEAVASRYELLMIAGRLTKSRGQKTMRLAVSKKLGAVLKAAYQRLLTWLGQIAPQLTLANDHHHKWLLFVPTTHPV